MFNPQSGNTAVKIATICKKGTWGPLVRQACFRRGYKNVSQYFDGIDKIETLNEYDVIFIDESNKDNMHGPELLEYLKVYNKVPQSTAVILIGESKEGFLSTYDLELQVVEYLASPFSEKDVIDSLEHVNKVVETLRPSLAFVNNGKYAFALKALKALKAVPKEKLTLDTVEEYYRFLVNLNYKLGQYEKVLTMCDSKLVNKQYWSMWPKFKANYELGHWDYCLSAMEKEPFSSVPHSATKLFWQIRGLVKQQKYADAIELLEDYPAHQMSGDMIRLTFTIYTLSGHWQKAEEFIERKIRMSIDDARMYGILTMSLCNAYLYQYFFAPNKDSQNRIFEVLKKRLTEFRRRPNTQFFKNDILFIDTMLLVTTGAWQDSEHVRAGIVRQLGDIENNNPRAIMNCYLAYAWFMIGENERAFDNLVIADIAFTVMPFGCERLVLGIAHKQVFNIMFAEQSRHLAYKKIGDMHYKEQRFKLSCKAYSRSIDLNPNKDPDTRKRLARSMNGAGIMQFNGFTLDAGDAGDTEE